MDPAIAIDHAVFRVIPHPRSAHKMMRTVERPGRDGASRFLSWNKGANPGGRELVAENFLRGANTVEIQFIPAPHQGGFPLAQGIGLRAQ